MDSWGFKRKVVFHDKIPESITKSVLSWKEGSDCLEDIEFQFALLSEMGELKEFVLENTAFRDWEVTFEQLLSTKLEIDLMERERSRGWIPGDLKEKVDFHNKILESITKSVLSRKEGSDCLEGYRDSIALLSEMGELKVFVLENSMLFLHET
ncbi:hypothetical protein CEXT_472201 [Caerostris extrusa]|uniref:Uncharacterized protein n=1 Tax=Caerostris extrusa TaxID=172846 RepID=A0AAV4U7W5_CAEEX|nr:hypothetical protein CEXT_472201 [Caerostris extrusa]